MTTSDSSHYPLDAENVAEMARLVRQARVLTTATGLLPPNISLPERPLILDLACGPGEWVLAMAEEHPEASITGADISQLMTSYARSLALEKGRHNVHFKVTDITQPLPFPDESFDLIHIRYVAFVLAPMQWPSMLAECHRILKPGGRLLGTETEGNGASTSPSGNKLMRIFQAALHRAGQSFAPESDFQGITAVHPRLLREAGFNNLRREVFAIDGSAGADAHDEVLQNAAIVYTLIVPFLVQMGVATSEEVSMLLARAIEEMNAPEFCSVTIVQRMSATKPLDHA